MAPGNGCIRHVGASGVSPEGRNRNPVQRCSTVTRSPPVPSVAMHEATTGEQTIWGRKRHLVVDTLGLILSVHVRPAALTDREGGTVVLTALLGTRPRLPVLWAERGSAGHPFTHWGKEHRDGGLHIVTHAWTGIRGVWAPEGTNVDGDTILPTGFPVLPTRGIGERPVSWLTRSRRLSRDGEGTSSSGEAFLSVALTTRMASTLARLRPSMTPLYTLSELDFVHF